MIQIRAWNFGLDDMGFKLDYRYDDGNRVGDHICYISDLSKTHEYFPGWKIEYDLSRILGEIVEQNVAAVKA